MSVFKFIELTDGTIAQAVVPVDATGAVIVPGNNNITEKLSNVAIGANTIAHGVSEDIYHVMARSSGNRMIEFADLTWDGTNISVNSLEALTDVTFLITHKTA